MRVANRDCRKFVNSLRPFEGSNLEGYFMGDAYVVSSYGWFPLFVNKGGKWYTHEEKYSVSTSKQKNQSYPDGEVQVISFSELKGLAKI